MPDEDRKALRRCHVALLDNIGDVMFLCDQLYQHDVFDSDDLDEVEVLKKRRDRNAYVLREIQTRGNVLDFFIKVMQAKRENQGAAAILQKMRCQVYSGAVKWKDLVASKSTHISNVFLPGYEFDFCNETRHNICLYV